LTHLVLWEVLTSVLQILDFSKKPPVLDILKNQDQRTPGSWVFKKIKIKEPLDPGYLKKSE
jgi:hypothetical protein